MTLQTWRCGTAEETARHFGFLRGKQRRLLWNVRERLARKRLEEADQFAEFVLGERERGHTHLQIRAHTVAIGVRIAERGIAQEPQQPLRIDACALSKQLRRQL